MGKTYAELYKLIQPLGNGAEYFYEIIKFHDNKQPFDAVKYLQETFDCTQDDAQKLVMELFEYIDNTRNKYASKSNSEPIKDINTPTCPKCGSTAITTTARGVGFIRGFLGANETVNRCGNCSYTWKPSKWL